MATAKPCPVLVLKFFNGSFLDSSQPFEASRKLRRYPTVSEYQICQLLATQALHGDDCLLLNNPDNPPSYRQRPSQSFPKVTILLLPALVFCTLLQPSAFAWPNFHRPIFNKPIVRSEYFVAGQAYQPPSAVLRQVDRDACSATAFCLVFQGAVALAPGTKENGKATK